MRVIRISLAIWHDPHWRPAFRKSWKTRRYWLARPDTAAKGRRLSLQFGPLTFKIHLEGKDNG